MILYKMYTVKLQASGFHQLDVVTLQIQIEVCELMVIFLMSLQEGYYQKADEGEIKMNNKCWEPGLL